MPAQRDDYILRQIDLLRQAVAKLLREPRKDQSAAEDTLQLALHLQEKLFNRPAPEFLQLPIDEQIAALRRSETPQDGRAKCLTYAELLGETAALYAYRGRDDLATGARMLALHVLLTLALEPDAPIEAASMIAGLVPRLELTTLCAPTREMLDRYTRQPR